MNIEDIIKEVIDPETNNSIIDLKFLKGYNIDKN
ncbi:metal-sulfur cluster biosynthetic enzyme, partial [Sulfolobus sp. A20-N-G8]